MNQWFQSLMCNGWEQPSPLSLDYSGIEEKTGQDVAAFLGDAMAKLSVHERDNELEDLHGIVQASNNKEHPDSVQKWLVELDKHINAIKRGTVYEMAESMNTDFVNDRDFRMMFLRAERYNPEAAANRVIKFLNVKRHLFGVNKLVKTISLDYLDDDDKACLMSGSYQLLPCADTAGRSIFVGMPSLMIDKPFANELRARYYLIMSALESEQSQLRGFVAVWYALGNFLDKNIRSNQGLLWDLPVRLDGVHLCADSMKVYALASAAIYRLPRTLRSRTRLHVGSHMECQHALASFGIPRSAVPVSLNDAPIRENHLTWLKRRQHMEIKDATSRSEPSEITGFTYADVIFGRGRKIQEHVGNVNLRKLLERNLAAYDQCTRLAKQDMAEYIVRHGKANGSRFLKHGDSGWEEVSDSEARIKVSSAFRSQRKFAKEKGGEAKEKGTCSQNNNNV